MKRKILILLLAGLLSSCSLWDNFVTYFNTFYNAQRDYNLALESIKKGKPDPFEFKFKKIPNDARKLFGNVIKNLSDILQHHPNSKYANESLLMLGKVFYYEKQFPKAERKFRELASKGKTEYYLENLLWSAKTDLQMRKFDNGLKILQVVKQKASEVEDLDLLTQAYFAEMAFYIFRENYEKAIADGKAIFNVTTNDENKALISYELGNLYKKIGNYDKAALWYARVPDYSPDFETEFRSKLEYAKMQRELGNYDKSETLFLDLRDDAKFLNYKDEIEEELGLLYFKMGEIGEAIYQFTQVDSLYKGKETAGEAKYMLGKIMDNIYRNYDSAYVYYQGVGKSKAPDSLKLATRKRLNVLDSYFKASKKQKIYFKKFLYATNPEIFKKDSIDYENYLLLTNKKSKEDSLSKKDSTKNKQLAQNLTIEERMALFQKKKREEAKKRIKPERPKLSADSLKSLLSEIYLKKGNLFFSELNVPDSAYIYYRKIVNDFDSTRNDPAAYFNLGAYYRVVADSAKGDSLYKFVVEKYPFSPFAEIAARKLGIIRSITNNDPSQLSYLNAETEMDSSNYSDALDTLKKIPIKFPSSPVVPQALYTIGWIYENVSFQPDSAYSYYKRLVTNYKTTEYARAVNPKVRVWENKIREEERRKKAHQDSIKRVAMQDSLKMLQKNSSNKKEQKLKKSESNNQKENSSQTKHSKLALPVNSVNVKKTNEKKSKTLKGFEKTTDTTKAIKKLKSKHSLRP